MQLALRMFRGRLAHNVQGYAPCCAGICVEGMAYSCCCTTARLHSAANGTNAAGLVSVYAASETGLDLIELSDA